MSNQGATDSERPAQTQGSGHGKRKWVLLGLATLFLLCGAAYGGYWFFVARFQVSTDDAYVAGNLVSLTPRASGTVVAICFDNTQLVQEGQPVVLLDSTDARIALEQAEASLAQTVRQVQQLYQTVAQQEATVALQQAHLEQTKSDYQRDADLIHKSYVSVQDFQHLRTQLDVDRAAVEVARHELAANRAAVANTDLAHHPAVRLAAAKLRDAYVALNRTTLRAPVTGYVAKRTVQVGQRVSPGMALLAIIPLNQVWVDANFKETQLQDVRIGQPVTLTSDLYGSPVPYRGRVLGLGAGTGSVFELLPPQNATGNWIKVVQRVPVRIGLDAGEIAEHPLRLGLSMEVTVDTHDRRGPVLRSDPDPPGGYATDVYRDEDKGADALIARVVRENTVSSPPTPAACAAPENPQAPRGTGP
jgi:membrane fusion protein (multidrug efflux system)